MAETPELPPGYQDIPEEDRKKAKVFFDRARTVADSGQFEYAIEMYVQGLNLDPELLEAHQALREVSMRRKAGGGKPMGMFERGRLPKGDDKQKMLNAEKQLGYDPGNTDLMVQMMQAAQKAGCYDTIQLFVGPMLMRANADNKKPEFSKYIQLKEIYKAIGRYKMAVEACAMALKLKPHDMDLQHEMKNLAANMTIEVGGYASGGSFRDSIRDMAAQKKLMESDKDVRSSDALDVAVHEAEAAYQLNPNDLAQLAKYVDALTRTERAEYENQAIELLENAYKTTQQYKFRQRVGQITISQLNRMNRSLYEQVVKNPNDANLRKEYNDFTHDKTTQELQIYTETVDNYPTDTTARFEMGKRMFLLGQYDDVIPVFQQVRSDPKYRVGSTVLLARAFLEGGFPDEAVETLHAVIEEYANRGDANSKEMTYWYARALEGKQDVASALKNYSQVFQWDAKYRDVQVRIRALRGNSGPGGGARPPTPM